MNNIVNDAGLYWHMLGYSQQWTRFSGK